jgi:hypothetical protein
MPITADVFVIDKPSIVIGGVEINCAAGSVALVPDDKMADIETFCNPGGERPTSTKWTIDIDVKLSYGTGTTALWQQIKAMAKTKQTVVIKPSEAAVSAANPSATVSAWVPSIPFISGAIGEATKFTLTMSCVGEPVFAET